MSIDTVAHLITFADGLLARLQDAGEGCGGSGDADYFRQDNASGPGTPGPPHAQCKGTGMVLA